MDRFVKLPFYAKFSLLTVGIFCFGYTMFVARQIIVPIIIAIIMAILLHPVKNFFLKLRLGRITAIILAITVAFLLLAGLGFFIILQFSRFTDALPAMVAKFDSLITELIYWISGIFDISTSRMSNWMDATKQDIMEKSAPVIGQTLITIGGLFVALLLIPVYIFMMLYYEPIIIEFIRRSFHDGHKHKVSKVISEVKTLIQSYLSGLFVELIIVAGLDIAALIILGVDYAILLGIIAALLNLIPYIGGIIGVALPMMIASVTEESPWVALWVLVSFYIIQLIDNNYIVPKIVASKVKINALVSVIVVLGFGALWGIPGMFISIPLTAIVKLVADHVDSLKPFGFLLGDTMPHPVKDMDINQNEDEKGTVPPEIPKTARR